MVIGTVRRKLPNMIRYFSEGDILHLEQCSELIVSVHDVEHVVVPAIFAHKLAPVLRHRRWFGRRYEPVDFVDVPARFYAAFDRSDFKAPPVAVVRYKRGSELTQLAAPGILQRFDEQLVIALKNLESLLLLFVPPRKLTPRL